MNRKGFSIIELLVTITIFGVLVTVTYMSVSRMIDNSRRETYINTAKAYIRSLKTDLTEGRYEFFDTDTSYYVHINNIKLESKNESPYAPWEDAYVVVGVRDTANATYEYAWTSKDIEGWRVDLEAEDDLKKQDIYNDKERPLNSKAPFGARNKVMIINETGEIVNASQVIEMTKPEADECYSYEFIEADKTVKLTYYNKDCGSEVAIPGIIDGYVVREIYSYTFNNMGLTKVIIPGSVTKIGSRAFAYNNITELILPVGLQTIDNEAFMSNKLPEVEFPNTLTKIGARAFKTNELTSYNLPESVTEVGSCAFCDNHLTTSSFLYKKGDYSTITGYIGDLTEFPDNKFIIPSEKGGVALKTIGSSAFYNMSLTDWEVVIPNTVTKIESSAFNASGIGKVNLPDGLKTIGSSAFYNNKLTTLTIPSSVTSIGTLAFNCNQVTTGDIWIYKRTTSGIDNTKLIGYSGANRKNLVIPSTVTRIEASALRYLSLKGGITIPANVNYIGQLAFALNRLTWVDNGDGDKTGPFVYTRISTGGFDKTSLLQYAGYNTTNVVIPSQVTRLEDYAFYYSRIKGVTIPEGVTYIGNYCFQICQLQGTVEIPSTVTTIGTLAFEKKKTWTSMNGDLTEIKNKTGKVFNWKDITGGSESANFETGVAKNWYGDITITK